MAGKERRNFLVTIKKGTGARQFHNVDSDPAPAAAGPSHHPAPDAPPNPQQPAPSDQSPVMWEYKDPSGGIRGPFPSAKIYTWLQQGYFDKELIVRAVGGYWTKLEMVYSEIARFANEDPSAPAEPAVIKPGKAYMQAMRAAVPQPAADDVKPTHNHHAPGPAYTPIDQHTKKQPHPTPSDPTAAAARPSPRSSAPPPGHRFLFQQNTPPTDPTLLEAAAILFGGGQNALLAPPDAPLHPWYYHDEEGNMHGPYTPSQMLPWFTSGFFSPDTIMCSRAISEFRGERPGILQFKRLLQLLESTARGELFPSAGPLPSAAATNAVDADPAIISSVRTRLDPTPSYAKPAHAAMNLPHTYSANLPSIHTALPATSSLPPPASSYDPPSPGADPAVWRKQDRLNDGAAAPAAEDRAAPAYSRDALDPRPNRWREEAALASTTPPATAELWRKAAAADALAERRPAKAAASRADVDSWIRRPGDGPGGPAAAPEPLPAPRELRPAADRHTEDPGTWRKQPGWAEAEERDRRRRALLGGSPPRPDPEDFYPTSPTSPARRVSSGDGQSPSAAAAAAAAAATMGLKSTKGAAQAPLPLTALDRALATESPPTYLGPKFARPAHKAEPTSPRHEQPPTSAAASNAPAATDPPPTGPTPQASDFPGSADAHPSLAGWASNPAPNPANPTANPVNPPPANPTANPSNPSPAIPPNPANPTASLPSRTPTPTNPPAAIASPWTVPADLLQYPTAAPAPQLSDPSDSFPFDDMQGTLPKDLWKDLHDEMSPTHPQPAATGGGPGRPAPSQDPRVGMQSYMMQRPLGASSANQPPPGEPHMMQLQPRGSLGSQQQQQMLQHQQMQQLQLPSTGVQAAG